MIKEYDAIFIGGNRHLVGGRILAGYRLRTEGRKYGYETLVVDTGPSMTSYELISLLEKVITKKTILLGFSTAWLDGYKPWSNVEWISDDFFNQLKNKFPHAKLVSGGPGGPWVDGSTTIYKNSDWSLVGFSDIAYTKLLDLLSGKKDHGLKYFVDTNNGKKVVQSDSNHVIINPNDIETVLEPDDKFLSHQPIPLEVSRGCIFRCSFCTHPFQGAKDFDSYQRTPESLANELKRNFEYFGTTRYNLMDDTFNDSMEKLDRLHRAIDLAKIPDFKFTSYIKPELLVTKPGMIDKMKALGIEGGFVGLESMNPIARKSIKKGMQFDKVADAIKLFKQRTNVKLMGSYITGLPGDTIDSQHATQAYMIKNQDDFCATWTFQSLIMYIDNYGNSTSEMARDPTKFGYEVFKKIPRIISNTGNFLYWKNEYMDSTISGKLTMQLNTDARSVQRAGGWFVSTAWHMGISDIDIETKRIIDLKLLKGPVFERTRAIEFLKKFSL